MIKSNKVYNARSYLEYIGIKTDKNDPMNNIPFDFIQIKLKENNKSLWNYPLDFYNNLQHQEPDIVLVDCTYYDGKEFIQDFRWFEV